MENHAQLKQFRDKVLSKISSFFTSESDIKLCVHESLADFGDNSDLKGWISLNDYEDTKPLHEEIASLRKETERLQKELKSLINITPNKDKKNYFNNEIDYLIKTKVKIPENIGDREPMSLMDIFYGNKDTLITGVTNRAGISDAENFLYHNIAPKLMIHGLMANEKTQSATWRRSYVSEKGLAVLAQISQDELA